MQVKAVIFDLDGLMLETEAIAREIWLSEAQKQGVPLSRTLYDSLIGRTYPDIHDIVQEAFGKKADATKFIADCLARYKERIHQPIPQRPGLEAILDWCDEKGLRKVVGTSSGREFALVKLASGGLAYRFDAMVTGSDVERGKPAPDVFLKAAAAAREAPSACLVLEDSANGILAAKAAGIFSIMIPDLITPSPEIRAAAGVVLGSLAEVPACLASRGMVA
jgi:HAD superfamily hydrolase (TIGR01509 family)